MRKDSARPACLVSLVLAAALPASSLAADSYRAEVMRFRHDREERLKAPDGWLSVAGLHWLRPGENRFGSGPENEVVLPPSAPSRAGTFTLGKDGRVRAALEPGVAATLDGKPFSGTAALETDKSKLLLGKLTLIVHASGSRLGIRLKDPDSALRKSFRGLSWFPVDARWRLAARWKKYDAPKQVEITNVLGDVSTMPVYGCAELSLEGKTYCLEGDQDDDGSLEFTFRDGTSGRETYGAARFVDAPAPKDGTVVLDFNEAYNPPCAFNKYTTCPLPGPSNRLAVRVTAGEKAYKGAH